MTTRSTENALAEIWALANLPSTALTRIAFTGSEPVLPSSFRIGTAAQATIGASALAATVIDHLRTGRQQSVAVDARHAAVEFRSERYMRVNARPPQDLWDKIAGLYRTGNGRWVRLHTNFPHHRDGMLELLACAYDRDRVQAALMNWTGEALEEAAAEHGLVATMMRTRAEWLAHDQGRTIARLPLLTIENIGEAPPEPATSGGRPLSGIRVLDLTRIIAGPVCGRTLAAHGADVLRVTAPHLPFVMPLVMDAGRGKRSAHIDLRDEPGCDTLEGLLREADIFIQGYRPGGIARWGFSPEEAAALRPGLIYVSLSAYGYEGPWASRRGFDSLIQTASGINHAEAQAAGRGNPLALPCQALDHASGYLMACAAMAGLYRRMTEGGSWHVRVALAHTAHWLWSLGRTRDGFNCSDPGLEEVMDLLEDSDSAFGRMTAVRHAAQLSETPAYWAHPSTPLGAHAPVWLA